MESLSDDLGFELFEEADSLVGIEGYPKGPEQNTAHKDIILMLLEEAWGQ